MRDKFIDAIHSCLKIQLTFYSKEDNSTITRLTSVLVVELMIKVTDSIFGITKAIKKVMFSVCNLKRLYL